MRSRVVILGAGFGGLETSLVADEEHVATSRSGRWFAGGRRPRSPVPS